MNLELINFKLFIENDQNPFIVFGTTGNIIYLNNSAEMLLCYTQSKTLYEIAITYAPKTFGHKNTIYELEFDNFKFYSIMVGYECDEQIYLRLYNRPLMASKVVINNDSLVLSDINILLEANLTMFQMQSSAAISLLADQELPQFKLDQNSFSKILRKAFSSFLNSDAIDIKLKLLFGEYIIIDENKYQIVELILSSESRDSINDDDITTLINQTHIALSLKHDRISFHIPLMI